MCQTSDFRGVVLKEISLMLLLWLTLWFFFVICIGPMYISFPWMHFFTSFRMTAAVNHQEEMRWRRRRKRTMHLKQRPVPDTVKIHLCQGLHFVFCVLVQFLISLSINLLSNSCNHFLVTFTRPYLILQGTPLRKFKLLFLYL